MIEKPAWVVYNGNERYWLFNTDETEREGEGAWRDMLAQSVIAAWGNCRGSARKVL
jgi:hypothetical protein